MTQLGDDIDTEEEEQEDDDSIVEAAYERFRDDQVNTGVISAVLGGFALTNSWEMDIGADTSRIDLAAYTLAILSVHGCTCSALASAFLYRSLTQKSPRAALRWMNRHGVLAHLPWFKFMLGTFCYIASVCLVSWSILEVNAVAQGVTLFAGSCGCLIIMYTIWVVFSESDGEDGDGDEIGRSSYIRRKRHRRYRHKESLGTRRISHSGKERAKHQHPGAC